MMNSDFESWFNRTYGGPRANKQNLPVIHSIALAAWEAATEVERERCAWIAGDMGGVLSTCATRTVTTDSLADVAFEIAKKIRGKGNEKEEKAA